MAYLERYAEMLRSKNRRFELVDGQLFVRKQRWIVPMGPVARAYALDAEQCRVLLRKLGGLWVQWTDGLGPQTDGSEWYALVCRKHVSVEGVASANARKNIRRGIRRCEVRQVDVQEIARNGYETYCAALRGYGQRSALPTAAEFARRVMEDEPFSDIRHRWAAYHEGTLIGFNQNLVYDDIEVDYTLGKYHPEYLQYYPAYALFNAMNEYYLVQKKFQYINAGFRSISHDTEVQDFLVRLFNFHKEPTGLHVWYRPAVGRMVRMARPLQSALTPLYPPLSAVFEMDRLRIR
jgi:hypothetical protein